MLYTNNLRETLLPGPTSRQIGKHRDNAFRATRANSHSVKGSVRPPSTLPQPQDHGTINQSQWISTKLERQEEIGEGEGEAHKEGM